MWRIQSFMRAGLLALLAVWSFNCAGAESWKALKNQPDFAAIHMMLLTDGSVICQAELTGHWYRLTPDKKGSYIDGTWTKIADMPEGYAPLYYASAVLADGRAVVMGGEYNGSGQTADTNRGAIYDPMTNEWSNLDAPGGFFSIGDAQSVVLPDGKWMLADPVGNCTSVCGRGTALLDPATLTWTTLSSNLDVNGKADSTDEEGWTLLPDGTVLTVDTSDQTNSERYFPRTNTWNSAGSTLVSLVGSGELGPAVLRPNGTVFATGACSFNPDGTCASPAHTAVYTPPREVGGIGLWTPGPDFPDGLNTPDGPASILPNGHVLVMTSPGANSGAVFFEFDGTNLNRVPGPPNAFNDPSFVGSMLLLPTGQVMLTDFSHDIEVYTSSGTHKPVWAPTIKHAPVLVRPGSTYAISGTQFNGLSQGAAYGDDAQMSTNYPLVRVRNKGTGHVAYWRTHDHSTMAVATGNALVSTHFDVPGDAEEGIADLVVVANGIPSSPRIIMVGPPPDR